MDKENNGKTNSGTLRPLLQFSKSTVYNPNTPARHFSAENHFPYGGKVGRRDTKCDITHNM